MILCKVCRRGGRGSGAGESTSDCVERKGREAGGKV